MVPWVMTAKKEKVPKKQKKQQRSRGEEGTGIRSDETGAQSGGQLEQQSEPVGGKPEGDKTFLRYYHLYRKGELEADIEQAGGVVVESGYEKDNWWAIASLR